MSEASSFAHVSQVLEDATRLSRIEARGTVRLALKQAGFDASSVTASQMSVVVERILPDELRSRDVSDADSICRDLVRSLASLPGGEADETPESVFRRLAGA